MRCSTGWRELTVRSGHQDQLADGLARLDITVRFGDSLQRVFPSRAAARCQDGTERRQVSERSHNPSGLPSESADRGFQKMEALVDLLLEEHAIHESLGAFAILAAFGFRAQKDRHNYWQRTRNLKSNPVPQLGVPFNVLG